MRFFQIFIVLTSLIFSNSNAAAKVLQGEISAGFAISLNDEKVIFNKDELTLLNPASTLKAVTALISLENLSEDFSFSTKLYTDSAKENLFLEFDGNPYLTFSELKDLFGSLEKKEYKKLHIIYDEDSNESYSNGANIEDMKFCFLAPSSQVSINQNCEIFNLIESTSSYSPAKTQHAVKLAEEFSILDEKSKEQSELDLRYLGGNQYKLIGKSKKSDLPKKLNIAVQDQKKFLLDSLEIIKQEQNIVIHGHKFIKSIPNGVLLINQANSPVVKDMIKVMMKKSDNHVADALFKKLANTYSFKKAAQYFETELYRINKNLTFKIVDGSGISVHNLISAKAITLILKHGFSKSKKSDDFLEVFPSSEDSESKFNSYEISGATLHAKTGSLESTSTLVGLVNGDKSGKIVFASFVNNSILTKAENRAKNKDFVKKLLQSDDK